MTRDEIIERLNWYPPNVSNTDTLIVKIESIVRRAEAAEREWLAGALEDQCRKMSDHFETKWLFEVIKAIRARGEK